MYGGCRGWWTGVGEVVARLDRKGLALGLLLVVGCTNLAVEQRRNQLAWRELPAAVEKGAVELAAARRASAIAARREDAADRPPQDKKFGRVKGSSVSPRTTNEVGQRPGPVDLNRASVGELEALPGLGPALASRVVAYRETNGPYRSVADLERVSGIGPVRLARLAALVQVGEAAEPAGGR